MCFLETVGLECVDQFVVFPQVLVACVFRGGMFGMEHCDWSDSA